MEKSGVGNWLAILDIHDVFDVSIAILAEVLANLEPLEQLLNR
jgi:hypothetical protein